MQIKKCIDFVWRHLLNANKNDLPNSRFLYCFSTLFVVPFLSTLFFCFVPTVRYKPMCPFRIDFTLEESGANNNS